MTKDNERLPNPLGSDLARRISNRLDAELGRIIREARLEMGFSQESLGQAVGVSFQQIQKYESGQNRISFSRLMLIAYALRAPVESLVFGVHVDWMDYVPAEEVAA